MTPHWLYPAGLVACSRAQHGGGPRLGRHLVRRVTIMTPAGVSYTYNKSLDSVWVGAWRRMAGVLRPRPVRRPHVDCRTANARPAPVALPAALPGPAQPPAEAGRFLRYYQRDPIILLAVSLVMGAMLALSYNVWADYTQVRLHTSRPAADEPGAVPALRVQGTAPQGVLAVWTGGAGDRLHAADRVWLRKNAE